MEWRESVVSWQKSMGMTSAATRERVNNLKLEYDLSEKAARFVDVTLEAPELPTIARAKAAGYSTRSVTRGGYERLKSPKIKAAVVSETRKRANVKKEMEALKANPREYLGERFMEHAADPEIQPNQTRALELVGKLEGLFVERIEIDPGQNLRSQAASQYITGLLVPPPETPEIEG